MCAISKIINNVVEYYFFRNRRPNKKESTRVRKKRSTVFLNNFNKFNRIFTIFGTHYPEDTFY